MMVGSLMLNNTAWVLPVVVTASGQWIIYVRVVNRGSTNFIRIKKRWFDVPDAFPEHAVALYNTLSWKAGEPRPTTPTIIANGKQGRSAFQQAVAEATAKWKRRNDTAVVATSRRECGTVPPMLLKVMDVEMTNKKFEEVNVEWYAQRKYDGIRCVACYSGGQVNLYSRTLKEYDVPHVADGLTAFLSEHRNVMLDGELYIHGVPLQTLSGAVRRSKNEPIDAELNRRLRLVVFDVYLFGRPDATYVDRKRWLDEHFSNVRGAAKLAETYLLGSSNPAPPFMRRVDDLYRKFLDEGYEGMVIRRADGVYVPGYRGKHTEVVMKHKPLFTDVFKCVGYEAGRGKEHDAVIWICQTKNGKQFKARPKQTYDERRKIYNALQNDPGLFNRKYKNKPITIEYASLSIDGIPQQPRAVAFRDYE